MKKYFMIVILVLCIIVGSFQPLHAEVGQSVVSFDGVRIAYASYGDGDTALIFIHGWSCDGGYWEKQVPAFTDAYRVVTVDLAGHGNSTLERTAYTVSSYAKDIQAVMRHEGIGRAILIGHSMGGAVIAEAARIMPDEVVALVGVDTLHNVARAITQEEMDEMLAPLREDFPTAARDFVSGMFLDGADPALREWVLDDMSRAPKNVALSEITDYFTLYKTGEVARIFEATNVPVCAINARLWPTNVEENRKHMTSFDVVYVEECGHFLMMEKPDEFNAVLRTVIEGLTV